MVAWTEVSHPMGVLIRLFLEAVANLKYRGWSMNRSESYKSTFTSLSFHSTKS